MSFVLKKLFSKNKEPKTPTSALDMTQSMIDFITDDIDSYNHSFQSHQPQFERSFSSSSLNENKVRGSPTRAETEPDFPTRKTRLNISSVLNTPKRGTIMEDLYDILQEQIIDQVGEMLQPTKKPIFIPKLFQDVQQKDFDLYIARLRKAHEIYKRNNAIRLKQKQREQTNMAAKLVKCYEIIPSHYFERSFAFNFDILVKDRAIIFKAQEDLAEFVDIIDESLYHQVTHKFEEFLDIVLKINKMESQIRNSLYSVKYLRNFNQGIKQKFSDKVQGVLKLKRRKINIEKTLALIDIINIVRKTLPTLIHLIQKNNFDSAVKLVKTSEETYKTKLKQVKSLKNFNVNFNEARNTLEKLLATEFEDRCINYLTPALLYNKNVQTPQSAENADQEAQFLLFVSGNDEAPNTKSLKTALLWKLTPVSIDLNVERNISKIILEYIKIKDFPLTVYKGKLLEAMKKFHKKFLTDVQEFRQNLNQKNSNSQSTSANQTAELPFELNLKFIVFYFEVFQRFLTLHLQLNTKILSTLMEYYNDNFVEKNNYNPAEYPYFQVLDTKATKDLTETVQEFYLTLAMIFKYFNDRLSEVILLANLDNISLKQFTKLVSVFEYVTNYFQNTLKLETSLNSWIVSDKEGLKKQLLRLVSAQSDKITLSPLQSFMIEIERNFINRYHKNQLDQLKSSLEQETWIRVEVTQESQSYFSLFSDETNVEKEKSIQKTSDGIQEGEQSNITADMEGNPQEQTSDLSSNQNEEKENDFQVLNGDIHFKGNKFQVTQSFLLLVQNIREYCNIGFRFKFIGLDVVSKIFELIKFYNSYTTQLILGAAATTFGKIPRITAKFLGVSSISLSLLVLLIDPLYKIIVKKGLKINQEWLSLEVAKVKLDIQNHINEIRNKIRSILKSKLIEQSNELKKVSWASLQEKIPIPTKYSTSIVTNTTQMGKQIQAFLLPEELALIAQGILEDFNLCMLPVFENIDVESGIAAKRVKEELQCFSDKLSQIPLFQDPRVKFSSFEDRINALIDDKCNHYLEATSIN